MKKDLKIFATTVDGGALEQIYELANLKAFEGERIRIMPDTHKGTGCVIGFTSTFSDKIIPNIVGVDLSCGVLVVNLGRIDLDLPKIDNFIKTNIPMGRNINKEAYKNGEMLVLRKRLEEMACFKSLQKIEDIMKGCGSLGGGRPSFDSNDCLQLG